ncbi:MAG TPA: hypothetical protein VGG19_00270 [Tepidisphaeraceae bacterium]|jgi:hypothetical protein
MIAQGNISALFVAWQSPESRSYYPIGRLISGVGPEGDLFEFAYIRGAIEAQADGFAPLLAFPHFDVAYRSRELFPFFSNRLMSSRRGDFPQYVEHLGLPANADPMTILSRGGTRITDTFELFPLPQWDENVGCFQTVFWMHGFRHLPPQNQARVMQLRPDEELEARPEPSNGFDPNAMQLFSQNNILVGWVPRYLASDAVHLLQSCGEFHVYVERVNQEPAPLQQRLLCRLESCWPDGFQPCAQDAYQPISDNAVKLDPCLPD